MTTPINYRIKRILNASKQTHTPHTKIPKTIPTFINYKSFDLLKKDLIKNQLISLIKILTNYLKYKFFLIINDILNMLC